MKLLKISALALGGIAISIGSAAVVLAVTATTTISSAISPVISMSTSGTVNVDVVPTGAGAQTIAADTVTVSTNDTSGYTLQLEENAASTDLVSGSYTIPHSSASQGTPLAMSVNTWGYRVDGIGGFGAGPTSGQSSQPISGTIKFAAVPDSGSPNTIKTTSGTATNDTTSVWYGVAADTSQQAGTYTNVVKYTATAN